MVVVGFESEVRGVWFLWGGRIWFSWWLSNDSFVVFHVCCGLVGENSGLGV